MIRRRAASKKKNRAVRFGIAEFERAGGGMNDNAPVDQCNAPLGARRALVIHWKSLRAGPRRARLFVMGAMYDQGALSRSNNSRKFGNGLTTEEPPAAWKGQATTTASGQLSPLPAGESDCSWGDRLALAGGFRLVNVAHRRARGPEDRKHGSPGDTSDRVQCAK
jgi:hypothetical protein